MDIKTRLEDDTVLFGKFRTGIRAARLKALNSIGIYTIEDFINSKESDFPKSSREFYWAMSHIFRHEYLGEDLVCDVLLEKEYAVNYSGAKSCYHDLTRLGWQIVQYTFIDHVISTFSEQGLSVFSMEEFLRRNSGDALTDYYITYMEKKKNDKQPALDGSAELSTLKIQLQTLVSLNESLQAQIDELQEKINKLEGGQSVHGK